MVFNTREVHVVNFYSRSSRARSFCPFAVPRRERKWLLAALVIQYLMLTFLTKKPNTGYHLSRFLIYMLTYLIKSDSTPHINPSQKCTTKLYKNITKTRKLFSLRNKIRTLTLELTAGQGVIFQPLGLWGGHWYIHEITKCILCVFECVCVYLWMYVWVW